jgi:hypothetical protein
VLKAVVRANHNNAGIYGTVTRAGLLAVGHPFTLRGDAERKEEAHQATPGRMA